MEMAIVGETEQSTEIIAECKSLTITSGDSYQRGAMLFGLLGDMIKHHEAEAKPHIDDANKTLKGLRESLRAKVEPLEGLKSRVRLLMANYDAEQTRLARDRQLELECQAKAKADADAKELKDKLAELELHEEAAQVKPEEVAPIIVQKDVPKVEGIKFVPRWHYEVTSVQEMLKGFCEGTIPWQAFEPSKGFLQKQTNAMKDELKYPGVRVWSDKLPQ